jgi:predicted molibdopterin-dependent oxidoreductase YjgC
LPTREGPGAGKRATETTEERLGAVSDTGPSLESFYAGYSHITDEKALEMFETKYHRKPEHLYHVGPTTLVGPLRQNER